eukprot:scaffold8995_cov139-Cylindrotheca_fusiformis.AAC.6
MGDEEPLSQTSKKSELNGLCISNVIACSPDLVIRNGNAAKLMLYLVVQTLSSEMAMLIN